MSLSQIAVPIPTKLFLLVAKRLKEQGSDRDPVDAIHHVIEQWLSSGSATTDPVRVSDVTSHVIERPALDSSRRSEPDQFVETAERDGYWWKLVFLPSGTKVRMTYRGRMAVAEISAGGIVYQGQTITPSEFTHRVTSTNRNAWRDIEVQFPDTHSWVSADDLRKSASKTSA